MTEVKLSGDLDKAKSDKLRFLAVINEETAESIARWVIESFGPTEEGRCSLDYDFSLSRGVMVSELAGNTSYSVDFVGFETGSNVVSFLKDETIEIDDDMKGSFEKFLQHIKSTLQLSSSGLADAMSRSIFKKEGLIRNVTVSDVAIFDLPEIDFILNIKKMTVKGYDSPSVSKLLIDEYLRTKEDFDTILKRFKDKKGFDFAWVTGVEKRKTFFEFEMKVSVDYSVV